MKVLRSLCLHFTRQDGQDGKKTQKESHATLVTKIPNTKRQKYGMNEIYMYRLLFFHLLQEMAIFEVNMLFPVPVWP